MKRIYAILIDLMMCFTLSSCAFETYATTQDDIYVETSVDVVQSSVDYSIVIRYGTPYYYNGSLLYYLYDGLYYYPYYYDNYWYMRVYRCPFTHLNPRPYFRPHRYDHRFHHDFRPEHNWYRYHYGRTSRPHNHYTNPGNYHRPGGSRPDIRPNQPPTHSHHSIGDRPSRGSTQPRITPQRGGSSRGSFGGSR